MSATKEMLAQPTLATGHDDLRALRLDLLRRSAEIYLEFAYPTGGIPTTVARRMIWTGGVEAEALLNGPPFERAGKAPGRATPIYALRLGNYRYPHMKLQVQPWPNEAGFMLSVNTHDQVTGLDLEAADAQAFCELQVENQRVKEAIELAWENAGLPTFLHYLRDYIKSRSESSSPATSNENSEAI